MEQAMEYFKGLSYHLTGGAEDNYRIQIYISGLPTSTTENETWIPWNRNIQFYNFWH